MTYSIASIADALGGEAVGDATIEIAGLAEPTEAGPSDLALALDNNFAEKLSQGRARAALLSAGMDWKGLGLEAAIFVTRSRYSLAVSSQLFQPPPEVGRGIDASAAVSSRASIGASPAIGPFVSIAGDVTIGERCMIGAGASISRNVRIGDDAVIGAGVRVGRDVEIGDRFIAQPNAVIGSDGFSYAQPEPGAIEEIKSTLSSLITVQQSGCNRIHSLGRVVIGDDVEIGANAAIDRGTISATIIGDRTKLDNLVHVAHNVVIGTDCLICGQVGIAGSARLGNRVVLGGMCGVKDHIEIGDDVLAAGASKIFTRIPARTAVMGSPAMPMTRNIEIYKSLRRLPRLVDQFRELKARLSKIGDDN